MNTRIKVDLSYAREVRASSAEVSALTGVNPAQLLLPTQLSRRRAIRILHYGKVGEPNTDVALVIGTPDIRWYVTSNDQWGFELHEREVVELEIDDAVQVYAILRDDQVGVAADLRILEYA